MEAFPAASVWAGRVLSGVAVAFLLFDVAGKLLKVGPVVDGMARLGYQEPTVVTVGVLLLVGVVLYLIPRTSLLGAIYLAAFLGGAVATQYRVGNPLATHVLFPVYVGGLLWAGLALRDPRLLSLLTGADR